MYTRVFHTKFWKDEFIAELDETEKLLFMYYLLNERVNIIHLYEVTDREVIFDTSIPQEKLACAKDKFQAAKKIYFNKNYVYLANACKYENYRGTKNEIAKKKLATNLSQEILRWIKGIKQALGNMGIDRGMDRGIKGVCIPTRNQKSKIRNQKSEKGGAGETQNDFPESLKKRFTLTDEKLKELCDKFPAVDVEFEYEKARDHLLANGGKRGKTERAPVKDYMAYLRNWMRKDWAKKKSILYAPPLPREEETQLSPEELATNRAKIEEEKRKIREKFNFKK